MATDDAAPGAGTSPDATPPDGPPGPPATTPVDSPAPSVDSPAPSVDPPAPPVDPPAPRADPLAVVPATDDVALRASIDVALSQPTVAAAFQVTWRAGGDRPALRRHGTDEVLSWAQYGARVREVAGGLAAIGLVTGDAVALLAGNVPAFNVVDTACLHVGAVAWSLYVTEPLMAMVDLVDGAGVRVLIAERRLLPRALEIAAALPAVGHVVVLDGAGGDGAADAPCTAGDGPPATPPAGTEAPGAAAPSAALDASDAAASSSAPEAPDTAAPCAAPEAPDVDPPSAGPEVLDVVALVARTDPAFDFDARWRAVGPEDVATLVHTSGTTGRPKGVELSHRALMAPLRGVDAMAPASPGGRGVSFLPAAHITDRWVCHYGTIGFGGTLTCVPDPDGLFDAIAETRPTRLFGVPRTWEKLGDRARALVAGDPERERALQDGHARVREEQATGAPTPPVGTPPAPAAPAPARSSAAPDPLAAVREALGLADAEWLAVAAAPSSIGMLELHHALGLRLVELWGMSEFIMAVMNPPGRIRLGSVGVALPAVELRLADDGELLLRGPHACSGYRGDPVRSAELRRGDGWVGSGDVATIDADGYLRIVGRKKELMINSSGKNLFPAKIEGAVAEASALIGHVASIGDRRRFVAALIVLDAEELRALAEREGLTGDHAALCADPVVRAEVERAVAAGNATLARVEQVRAFAVLPDRWTPGDAVLTPTAKLRRTVVAERYAAEIEALYPA